MAKLKPLIFGGSFDPFHNGHLHLIKSAEEKKYNPIYLIPTFKSPVGKKLYASYEKRIQLCKLGTSGMKNVEVSDFEGRSKKSCYAIDQIKFIKKIHKNQKISLLIGDDNLKEIQKWKNYKELIKSCTIVIATRMDSKTEKENTLLGNKIIKISSSEIRNKIKLKESIDFMVPRKIKEKIKIENLYDS